MIFSNRNTPESWGQLEQGVKDVLEFVTNNNMKNFPLGEKKINGDDLYVNVVEYTTTEPENRFWEAHKQYLDVHVPITGTEQIDLNFISNMDEGEYKAENDFLPLEGDKKTSVILNEGDFLVCYPEDAHRTAVAANGKPETVKKAIFKIKIK